MILTHSHVAIEQERVDMFLVKFNECLLTKMLEIRKIMEWWKGGNDKRLFVGIQKHHLLEKSFSGPFQDACTIWILLQPCKNMQELGSESFFHPLFQFLVHGG
jgi:hypothetical protein